MNYPKIYKYKDVYVKIDTDISVVIDKLLSVKNDYYALEIDTYIF